MRLEIWTTDLDGDDIPESIVNSGMHPDCPQNDGWVLEHGVVYSGPMSDVDGVMAPTGPLLFTPVDGTGFSILRAVRGDPGVRGPRTPRPRLYAHAQKRANVRHKPGATYASAGR